MSATLVLIIVLVIILALCLVVIPKGKRLPCLTSEARDEFFRYMCSHPDARAFEESRSGIPDVTRDPEKFFAVELAEKEHSDVARSVSTRGRLVDGDSMRLWISENAAEMSAGLKPNY